MFAGARRSCLADIADCPFPGRPVRSSRIEYAIRVLYEPVCCSIATTRLRKAPLRVTHPYESNPRSNFFVEHDVLAGRQASINRKR